MIYKPYGASGMMVSALGFGGMRFDTSRSMEENAELLQYAFSRGVNYFDTAPTYCNSQSESIFGHAFKHMRGTYYVSTKIMPSEKDSVQHTLDVVKKACETLNRDAIDVFHIWCLRNEETYLQSIRPGGLYEGLLKAQSQGLVKQIAFSSHQNGAQIRSNLERASFGGVLLGMNILNFPYRWDGVEAANAHGAGVVVMNPLYGGMIPKYEDKLGYLCEQGETPTQAALRFAIGTPQISVALAGITDKAHIDMACDVSEKPNVGISPEKLAGIREHLSQKMVEACTGCGYCDGCPKDINVSAYMLFYNPHHVFGVSEAQLKKEFGFDSRFGLISTSRGKAKDCVACGRCEKACTQHLPIIERMKKIKNWGG